MDLHPVPLAVDFYPECDMQCGRKAQYIAKGCMDKTPVALCDHCYHTNLNRLIAYLRTYQRVNKRVLICGDCHRPVFSLDTHLDVSTIG